MNPVVREHGSSNSSLATVVERSRVEHMNSAKQKMNSTYKHRLLKFQLGGILKDSYENVKDWETETTS